MANKKIFNELIQINNRLIIKFNNEKNAKLLEKHQIIASILEDDSVFEKIDISIALNIIVDIMGDEMHAFDIYKELMLTNNE